MKIKEHLIGMIKSNDLSALVKKYVNDKKYSLDDRWEVFCAAANRGLTNSESFIPHLDSLHDDIVMCDGTVHAERHQTFTMSEIVERYEDNFDEEGNLYKYNNLDKWNEHGFDPVAFKEEVMDKFIGSFTYDW